jgi:predicted DNA-binding transcriptional regulator YafY
MPITKNARKRHNIIDGLLRSHRGYTIKEIAQQVNEQLEQDGDAPVSERMIYNDIKNMQEEYPVNITRKDGRFMYETRDESIENRPLSEEDRKLLEMGVQTFSVFKGSALFRKFNDVITRLMTGSVLRRLHSADQTRYIQIGEMAENTGHEWIESVYQGITEQQALRITYKSYGREARDITVSPYLLKEFRNIWYMVAFDHADGANTGPKIMKLNRILRIEKATDAYIRDENFNGEDYFKYTLGVFHQTGSEPIEVKLQIEQPLIELLAENKIHPSMEIIEKTSDAMTISFTVYDSPELRARILSYGAKARVLSPESLQNTIAEEIRKMGSVYGV